MQESSEIGNVSSKEYLGGCSLHEIVKIIVVSLKRLSAAFMVLKPKQLKDIMKYLPVLVTIGEKPLAKRTYLALYGRGLIERPRKDGVCPICLKGTIRQTSAGIGSWEISCNKCMFLYDQF